MIPKVKTIPWFALAIALFLLWLFFSLGSYYLVQKPFTLPQILYLAQDSFIWQRVGGNAAALQRTLLDLLTGLWLLFIAAGVGGWLLRLSRWSPPSLLAEMVLSTGLGWGGLGLITLLLGVLQLYRPAVFSGLAVVLTLVALPQGWHWWKALRPRLRTLSRPSPLISLYLILVLGLALTLALLPPVSWDGLFYHLKGPKLYLQAGGLIGGIDIPHLNFPSLLEMDFLWAMAWRGDTVAHLVHLSFVPLLMGLVALFSRDWLKLPSARTTVLLLLSLPMVLSLGTWAYNDLALAFYSAAAVYLFGFWLWRTDSAQHTPLLLAGVFAGCAMSLKYTSIITPMLVLGLIFWSHRHDWRSAWRPVLMFALPAGLVVAPWLIKNWLLTGNPVYPFVFGGQFWDSYRAAAYAETGSGIGFNPIAILRLPYDLTIGLEDASQDGQTGPLFLASLPLLLFYTMGRLRHEVPFALKTLLVFALGYYLFWMLGVISSHALWQSRLLLPAYILLCPAVAWIWADSRRFDHPEFSLYRFLHIALALVLVLGFINQFLFWLGETPWHYLVGEQSRSASLVRRLGGHYEAMSWLNENLPDEAVVLFLWEPRSYYCDLDCRPDSILDRMGDLEYLYGDAEGIAAAWQAQGVTHVLLWRMALDFILSQEAETGLYRVNQTLLADLEQEYLLPVDVVGGYEVYQLRPVVP